MLKQSGIPDRDPFGGRNPTSHERMTGLPWDASYRNHDPAPWDIGRPHPVGQSDLRAAFNPSTGWKIAAIEADRIHTIFHGGDGAPAWLATIKRI